MARYQVGYFVGSLSSTSINRLLAQALVRLAPPELVMREIPIRDLPQRAERADLRMGKRTGQEIQGQESRPAGLSGCAEFPGDGRGRWLRLT